MAGTSAFSRFQPWVTLVVRVAAGVVMVSAGMAKALDLGASVRATRGYELLPEWAVQIVGQGLPFAEVLLGIMLILGLATRWSAAIYLLLLAAFMVGTASAWARGLNIDCGCFGGDGTLGEGVKADYLGHMLDQLAFTAFGAWVFAFPRSRFSVDGWLRASD